MCVYLSIFSLIFQGDSGGPLACRDNRDVWTVVGALSWGPGIDDVNVCAGLDVYTEISSYMSFIETALAEVKINKTNFSLMNFQYL